MPPIRPHLADKKQWAAHVIPTKAKSGGQNTRFSDPASAAPIEVSVASGIKIPNGEMHQQVALL